MIKNIIFDDRTNHCNDKLIVDFWKNYNDFVQSFYMK